jgi:hypothetical protein
VWIKGHRYYRRSRRVNGRIVTEHVGRGELAELEAQLDADLRKLRRLDVALDRLDFDLFIGGIQDVLAVDRVLADVFSILADQFGWHQHHRQWRRRRRFDMSSLGSTLARLQDLSRRLEQPDERPPLLKPGMDGVPEADRAVLAAAAKGDQAALVKARPYLEDPKYVGRWGNPAYAARCWLVGQVSGDNHLVSRATHEKAAALANELGFESAGPLERMAIYRIVNCWLAVSVLEASASKWQPHAKERLTVERCLALADRRLTASIKLLATVRRVPTEELLGRVRLADVMMESTSRQIASTH